MNYRQLGKSDLRVSELAFGCMSLGTDHEANRTLLHRAVDKGINFFDTADLYAKGENEITVGKAFEGKRKEIIIATKVGNQLKPDGNGWDWNPTKKYILEAVEKSLQRLQTDYIDLYQLHGGTIDDPIDETIEAFELLKKQGKIRAYGISSIRPNVIREYVKRSNMDSVMMQYSLLDRRPEESCLELLKQSKISVLTRGTFAQGLLLDKPATAYLNYSAEEVSKMKMIIQQIKDRNAAEVALNYVLAEEAVTSVVVGVRNEKQLDELNKLRGSKTLDKGEVNVLRNTLTANRYEQHR